MLNTIIVDDSPICVNMLREVCSSLFYLDLHCFTNPREAVDYSKTTGVSLALLDVDMPEINGLRLGQILKNINPETYLICISSKEDCCKEANYLNIDKYIFKPFNISTLSEHIEKAFNLNTSNSIVCTRTPDGFEFFCGQTRLEFSCRKARDLFALCVSYMGNSVDIRTAISALWPDRPVDDNTKKLYRKAIASLKSTISKYTDAKVFGTSRGDCYIYPDKITII